MFKGPNTRDEFCDWLFTEENEGAICIAHNLKAYDGYFILQYLYDQTILPELILNGTKLMSIQGRSMGRGRGARAPPIILTGTFGQRL